jgi:hypothetical protein
MKRKISEYEEAKVQLSTEYKGQSRGFSMECKLILLFLDAVLDTGAIDPAVSKIFKRGI